MTALPTKRFTVSDYGRMLDAGILREGDPYELLHGEVVRKMPQNTPHAGTAARLERRFNRLLPDEFYPWAQKPVQLPETNSEPEPDLAVLIGPEARYSGRKPRADDVLLVLEVSDASLALDRAEKLLAYAAAKIPVYWIVNIPDGRIEVYSQPRGGKTPSYRKRVDYARGESVPVALGGTAVGEVAVADILG